MAKTKAKTARPDIRDIERFLYDEADLLDRADLDGWFALFTEDGSYWMPAAPDQDNPFDHISLMYDDRTLMEVRRRNFGHPSAPSMDVIPRTSHLISNVRLVGDDAESGDLVVTSNFHVHLHWKDDRAYAGRYTHHLVPAGESFLIRRKRVDLIDCDAARSSLVIYL